MLNHTLPAPTDFGAPLPLASSSAVLDYLATRRSTPAHTLIAPGPDAETLAAILRLGARVPDHGKLTPWRFVTFTPESKARLVEALMPLAAHQADPVKASKALSKLSNPPVSVLVISAPVQPHPIPEWEQALSAACVCYNMLLAGGAFGFGVNWITDWYSYDPAATGLYGLKAGEKVAGFIHFGAAPSAPLERERPDVAALITKWDG